MCFIFLLLNTAFYFHVINYYVLVFQTFHFQHMHTEDSKVYTLTIMQVITICLYMLYISVSLI